MKKIALMSTIDNPLLTYYIQEISKVSKIEGIFLDSNLIKKVDKVNWRKRTSNKIIEKSIYEFSDNIPYYLFKNHSDLKMAEFVKKLKIDLLVACWSNSKLKKSILDAPRIGVLGCHPGILPNYRGCSCTEWQLYNKDPVGNTAYIMTEEYDYGPIICKSYISTEKLGYQDIRTAVHYDNVKCITKAVKIINKANFKLPKMGKKGKFWKIMDDKTLRQIIRKIGE